MVSFNYVSKSQELTKKGLILSALTRGQADQNSQVNFQSLNVGERSKVFQMECNLKWEAGRREKCVPFLTLTLHLLLVSYFPEILALPPQKTIPSPFP